MNISIKIIFLLFSLFALPVKASEAQGLLYGNAGGKGKSAGVFVEIQYCKDPPKKMTFVFKDGAVQVGILKAGDIKYYDSEGGNKAYAIKSGVEFEPGACVLNYLLDKEGSSQVLIGFFGEHKVTTKKFDKWIEVPFEKFDPNKILMTKSIGRFRNKINLFKGAGAELCELVWRQKDKKVSLGKNEEKYKASDKAVYDLKTDCNIKQYEDLVHLSCSRRGSRDVLDLTYLNNTCIGVSNYYNLEPQDQEELKPWGEIVVDGESYYLMRQYNEDVLSVNSIFLVSKATSDITLELFTPPPPSKIND